MPKSAILRTRIDPQHKAAAENILRKLGVTPTQAISMLYAQVIQQKGIPFQVSLNKTDVPAGPRKSATEVWSELDAVDYSHLLKK